MDLMHDYFDLQINGYGGVDFNQDELTDEQLHFSMECLRRDGVGGILATIITEQVEIMSWRIGRIVRFRETDPLAREIIAGIHVEGPFISDVVGYRGAHPVDAIRAADVDLAKQMIEAGGGLIRLFTLAPERDHSLAVTRYLASAGVRVSVGHSDASFDQLRAAVDAGLSVATHVGNGCPMTMHRHDNIIQRLLSLSGSIQLCFIADGVHVPFFALKNYLASAGIEHCCVVTDAMSAAGMGPGRYRISRWDLDVGEDLVVWAPDRSHFVGSAGTMKRSEQSLRSNLGLTENDCHRLLKQNPRRIVQTS